MKLFIASVSEAVSISFKIVSEANAIDSKVFLTAGGDGGAALCRATERSDG